MDSQQKKESQQLSTDILHPLEHEWVFWFDKRQVDSKHARGEKEQFESNLKTIGSFSTVTLQIFWFLIINVSFFFNLTLGNKSRKSFSFRNFMDFQFCSSHKLILFELFENIQILFFSILPFLQKTNRKSVFRGLIFLPISEYLMHQVITFII
jgi:hypothetical protein